MEDLPGWDTDQAVAAVYRAHYRSLARIAVLLAGDSAKGEAITQDAFAFMERARRLPASDRALGELRRAVVTRSRSEGTVFPDSLSSPPGLAALGTPGTRLMVALASLPERQREALVLKYYANWPDPQIAAAMGIRQRALNSYVRRGLSALRAFLAREGGDPA